MIEIHRKTLKNNNWLLIIPNILLKNNHENIDLLTCCDIRGDQIYLERGSSMEMHL